MKDHIKFFKYHRINFNNITYNIGDLRRCYGVSPHTLNYLIDECITHYIDNFQIDHKDESKIIQRLLKTFL